MVNESHNVQDSYANLLKYKTHINNIIFQTYQKNQGKPLNPRQTQLGSLIRNTKHTGPLRPTQGNNGKVSLEKFAI